MSPTILPIKRAKPPAFIHVDVDSDRTVGRFYGDTTVKTNCVYEQGLLRARKMFSEYGIPATFFINGVDLSRSWRNRQIINTLAKDNHEIASHSFSHPNGFVKLSRQVQQEELAGNIRILRRLTGKNPPGFRAPGYDIDDATIKEIRRAGHLYDSSLYPSILNPIIRFILTLERPAVDPGYGPLVNAFAPTGVHRWQGVWEVPVTVFPFLRLPFHHHITMHLPNHYLTAGLSLLTRLPDPVVYLFHAVEFVDPSDVPLPRSLLQHPALRLSLERRIQRARLALDTLKKNFRVERTDRYIEKIRLRVSEKRSES